MHETMLRDHQTAYQEHCKKIHPESMWRESSSHDVGFTFILDVLGGFMILVYSLHLPEV